MPTLDELFAQTPAAKGNLAPQISDDFVNQSSWETLTDSLQRGWWKMQSNVLQTAKWFADKSPQATFRPLSDWISKNAEAGVEYAHNRLDDPDIQAIDSTSKTQSFVQMLGEAIPTIAGGMAMFGLGSLAGGPVGGFLAAGSYAFAIEGQAAADNAIATGGSKEESEMERYIVGGLNGLVEVSQIGKFLRLAPSGGPLLRNLITSVRNRVWSGVIHDGKKLTGELLRTSLDQGLQEALQGSVSEGVPAYLRDLKVEDGLTGFLTRRGQEAAWGAAIGGTIGAGAMLVGSVLPQGDYRRKDYKKPVSTDAMADDLMSGAEIAPARDEAAMQWAEAVGAQPVDMQSTYERVVYGAKPGDVLSTNELSALGYGEAPANIRGLHIGDADYWKERLRKDYGRTDGATVIIRPRPTDMLAEDVQYNTDPETGEKGYSEVLATSRKGLQYGEDWVFKGEKFLDEQSSSKELDSSHPIVQRLQEIYSQIGSDPNAPPALYDEAARLEKTKVALESTPVVEDTRTPDQKLSEQVSLSPNLWKAQEKLYSEKRKALVGVAARIMEQDDLNGKAAFDQAGRALAGELPRTAFTAPDLPQADWDTMYNQIKDHTLPFFAKMNAAEGLGKIREGVLPQQSELIQLERVFGKAFVQPLIDKGAIPGLWKKKLISWMSIARSVKSGMDLSFLRQAVLVAPRHPLMYVRDLMKGGASIFSDQVDTGIRRELATRPNAERYARDLDLTDADLTTAPISATEELFTGNFALNWLENHKVPVLGDFAKWVRKFGRGYTNGLNLVRADLYDYMTRQWEGTGKTDRDYKQMGNTVMALTGRSTYKFLNKAPAMSVAFFSPRLFFSRIQAVTDLVDPRIGWATRKMLAAHLVSAIGVGTTVLGLLKLNGVDVEDDPRSGEFGMIRHGQTRFDIWGGYAQIIKFVAREASNEIKSGVTGRIYPANRFDTLARFIQSKAAPAAGVALEMIRGEQFSGEAMPGTADEWGMYMGRQVAPMMWLDIMEAFKFQGMAGGAAVAPAAFLGLGTNTYEKKPSQIAFELKNHEAQMYFGRDWQDVGDVGQEMLKKISPEIQKLEDQIKYERNDWEFLASLQAEQHSAGQEVEAKLNPEVRAVMTGLLVTVGGMSRRLSKDWYLNDKRYGEYIKNTTNILNKILPKITNGSTFAKLKPDVQKMLLDTVIQEVKKSVRTNIIDSGNLEDFQSLTRKNPANLQKASGVASNGPISVGGQVG